ncbi:MAG: hypothetical protein OHK0029_14650 [Armatimonadaceae bacterium]
MSVTSVEQEQETQNPTQRIIEETPTTPTEEKVATLSNPARGTACCVCGGIAYEPWRRAPDWIMGGWTRYTAVQCARCSTRRLQPRPSVEEMRHAYSAITYARAEGEEHNHGLGQRLDGFFERQADRAVAKYSAFIDIAAGEKPAGNLLDVGCGDGRFIAAMQSRGWRAEGLETDPVAAELTRNRTGVAVHEIELQDAHILPDTFHMISLLHVLEHVPDPRATLEAAYRALAPGGMLLLALPNSRSIEAGIFGTCWYPLDLPRHFWHFTPHTLTRLLEECGYRVTHPDYFPFLFALQSLRYAAKSVEGAPAVPPDPSVTRNEIGGWRTRFFLGLLDRSYRWGKWIPGEIMELAAFKPR